jgi:hypothetical protein
MDVPDTTENPQNDHLEPAAKSSDTGGAAEMPCNILGYVLKTSGLHQLFLFTASWVGERATRDLRRRIRVLVSSPSAASSGSEARGIQASMIVAEVEPIGAFVGASVSEPLLQGGMLLSVLAYMIHLDLWMAGTTLALSSPSSSSFRSYKGR